MLTIIVKGQELFDDEKQEFIPPTDEDDVILQLEHSLISLSKWESKFCKPFLGTGDKTPEEIIGYIDAMVLSGDLSDSVKSRLSQKNLDEINDYISSPQSATTFVDTPQQKAAGRSEVVTSELIYWWMASYQIPIECESWHLNRLFALLRIANLKNSKPRKMSKHEMAQQRRELNAQRRNQLNTKG